MRIALVIERLDIGRGGRETSTAQIAAALAGRGHAVTVLCQQSSWSCPGVEVRAFGRRGLSRAGKLRQFIADVKREMGGAGFDIVHSVLPVPGATIYQPRGGTIPAQRRASWRRRSHLGAAMSALTEPLNRHRAAMAKFERDVVCDPATTCLAVSDMVAEEFVEFYGRSDGVRTVFGGVDLPAIDDQERTHWRVRLRQKLGVTGGDPVFLTAARNYELKGVAETIDAFGAWRQRGVAEHARLMIVGRDPALAEGYRRMAALRGIGGQVVFEPPTDEMWKLYAAADVCVLLSWYDPCSRVVLEATRLGIPSITTACNGAAEIVHAGAGVVVRSPRDRAGVVAAMAMLADRDRRAECANACRRAADGLSMGRHVDELIETYTQVMTT